MVQLCFPGPQILCGLGMPLEINQAIEWVKPATLDEDLQAIDFHFR